MTARDIVHLVRIELLVAGESLVRLADQVGKSSYLDRLQAKIVALRHKRQHHRRVALRLDRRARMQAHPVGQRSAEA